MAYALDFVITLGSSKTGLSLKATLLDTAGSAVVGQTDLSTGFVELLAGTYQWHYAAFPDGHRGAVVFHTGAFAGTPVKLAASSVNPEEAENTDTKTSTRSTYAGGAVTLAASQPNYAPSKAGDAMTLTSAYDAAKTASQAGDAMALTAGERNSVADAILKRDWTAVSGEASRSVLNALRWLRNKWTISAGTLTVTKEDDTATAWSGPVTSTAGADPVTGVDPS